MSDHQSYVTFSAEEQNLVDLLKSTQIFSDLSPQMFKYLLPQFERVALSPGEILFEQNSPSDSLYVLLDGQLYAVLNIANKQEKVVGIIEPGQVVGEMGALSNEPRSLTVKAVTESKLIRLTRAAFQDFYEEYPNALFNLVETLIARSQNTIRLLSQKKVYPHVLLFSGDHSPLFNELINQLKKIMPPGIQMIDQFDSGPALKSQLNKDKTIILIVNETHRRFFNILQHHIGTVFCVVDGDRAGQLSPFAKEMLEKKTMLFSDRYDLVLLHADASKPVQGTSAWLAQAHFFSQHHINVTDPVHLQRMVRFIRGKAVGLVLGGGGTKLSALIGALKALEEAHVPIDAVGGTSAGAIIGGMYALYGNVDKVNEWVQSISREVGNFFTFKGFTWPLISVLSGKKPTAVLMRDAASVLIEDLWVQYFAQSTNLNLGTESIHVNGLLWQAMRASASVPGLVPPVLIKGQLHVDGGLLNNFPVDTMRSLLGPSAFIIGVSLAGINRVDQVAYDFPPAVPFRVGLLRKFNLGYQEYKFPAFIETFLRSLLVGASSKETTNLSMADLLIRPDFRGQIYLNNTQKQLQESYAKGYEAAKNSLLNYLSEHPDFLKSL